MSENTPPIDPDNPHKPADDLTDEQDKFSEQSEVSEHSEDEPDLLFANIDALMEGSGTPVSDSINLDDHDHLEDDEFKDVTTVLEPSDDEPLDALPDVENSVIDIDDYYQDLDEFSDEPLATTAEPEAISEESEGSGTGANSFFDEMDEPTADIVLPVANVVDTLPDPHSTIIELGFYGKLPAYGDFIQKRLPQNFINPWHEWLQTGMLAGRERNPDNWMTYYLNCPAWCFVMAAGVCGDQPVAGVTIPSVDRVGRYFNFTMASILPTDTDPAVFAGARHQWFTSLENFALSVLDQELDQDDIDRSINDLSVELSWDGVPLVSVELSENQSRIYNTDTNGVVEFLPALLHQMISRDYQPYGLWWHQGSSQVTAQLLSCGGMPTGEAYLDLLMDRDLRDTAQTASQASEVDYLDELLSD
jgi:type VI secretion system protein ImpM